MTSGNGIEAAARVVSAEEFEIARIPSRFAIDSGVFMRALEWPDRWDDDERGALCFYFVKAAEARRATIVVSTVVLAEYLLQNDEEWPRVDGLEYVAFDRAAARMLAARMRGAQLTVPGSSRAVTKWDTQICASAVASGLTDILSVDFKMKSVADRFNLRHTSPADYLARQKALQLPQV